MSAFRLVVTVTEPTPETRHGEVVVQYGSRLVTRVSLLYIKEPPAYVLELKEATCRAYHPWVISALQEQLPLLRDRLAAEPDVSVTGSFETRSPAAESDPLRRVPGTGTAGGGGRGEWTSVSDIRDLRFWPGTPDQVKDGLLGHVRFELGPVRLDGIQLRQGRDLAFALSFPTRTSRAGTVFPLVRPISSLERQLLTSAVVETLRLRGDLP